MTDEQHQALAETLHKVKGKVAISGYHGNLMDKLYADWHCLQAVPKNCHTSKGERTEILWVNYEVEEAIICQVQQTFLDQSMQESLAV